MSYILDALKKSEQKRKQGKVPDLPPPSPGGPGPRPKRSLWLALLAIALILNGGLLGWWLLREPPVKKDELRVVAAAKPRPVQKEKSLPPDFPAVKKKSALPPPPAAREERKEETSVPAKAAEEANAQGPASEATVSEPKVSAPAPEPAKIARQEKGSAQKATSGETAPFSGVPAGTVPKEQPEGKKDLYDLDELPGQVRRLVPEMAVSLHYYTSEPAARMVRINGLNLHEGNAVNRDVRVEEITPDGIIFSSSGYRFRVPGLLAGR